VAQSTSAIDWAHIELRVYTTDGAPAEGAVTLPDGDVNMLRVSGGRLAVDTFKGRVQWRITNALQRP
jgi:hypothetical protein